MPDLQEIGLVQARVVIDTIVDELLSRGDAGAVAVVDPHGELVAFLRSDGCPLASINNAVNKAFTAAREGVTSQVVGERSRSDKFPLTNFGDPRYTGWGGGVPIIVNGTLIGAVGVSGLPEEIDMELAQRGANSLVDGD